MTHCQETTVSSLPEYLETLVDRHGLREVLAALCTVCGDKEEHLRVNWQDKESARNWGRAYNAIYKAHNVTCVD